MNKIPRDPAWCSCCIDPKQFGGKSPCRDHTGLDGKPAPYEGLDAYNPTDWVLRVVGGRFTSWEEGSPVYRCIGYDPHNGFWMQRVEDPDHKRNISERAIGRNYHRVRMTWGAWELLETTATLGRLPTEEEAQELRISLSLASATLKQNGLLKEGALTDFAREVRAKYPLIQRSFIFSLYESENA